MKNGIIELFLSKGAMSLKKHLPDVQSQKDLRNVYIDKVGISDIVYPIVVLDRENSYQSTVGKINMYVDLPEDFTKPSLYVKKMIISILYLRLLCLFKHSVLVQKR